MNTGPIAACAVLAICGAASGQYSTGFEPPAFAGSAAGTSINGQAGWYTPVPFALDARVYTYAGNPLGLAAPPGGGGSQFVVCRPQANACRAEYSYSFEGAGVVQFTYDEAVVLSGQPSLPTTAAISSFALQPLNSAYFFASNRYHSITDPQQGWDATYLVAPPDPGGFVNLDAPQIPGPAWQSLQFGRWYRQRTTVDFVANRITSVSITDLTTGVTTTVNPTTYYLHGGTDPGLLGLVAASIVRLSGNNDPVNNTAFDNFALGPPAPPQSCYANCDNSTTLPFLNVLDFTCFLNAFAAGNSYANCDASTQPPVLNVLDFTCFLNRFAAGCSAP